MRERIGVGVVTDLGCLVPDDNLCRQLLLFLVALGDRLGTRALRDEDTRDVDDGGQVGGDLGVPLAQAAEEFLHLEDI